MTGRTKEKKWKQVCASTLCILFLPLLCGSAVPPALAAPGKDKASPVPAAVGRTKTNTAMLSGSRQTAGLKEPVGKRKQAQADLYRLPGEATPIEYDLSFTPDMEKFVYAGDETVKLSVLRPTREIVMNAHELKISCANLQRLENASTSEAASVASAPSKAGRTELEIKLEPETQKVRFLANNLIQPGTYLLSCHFEGIINNQLCGFYRAEYEDDAHQKRWLATTDMEPDESRRMFPGFDEPAYKAVFRVKTCIDSGLAAISNSPIEKEEPAANGKKTVIFEASPKMSSYLFALIIGALKNNGQEMAGNVPVRVWTVTGKEHLGNYALHEAAKILNFESQYFGIPYLGKKLDLIAIPEYTHHGMENIGAITFRESSLLVDEKSGSEEQRCGVVRLLAHEIAHQWFGDLVTMQWWDDLWLNEAFATWMAYKVTDGLHPQWHYLTQSIAGFRNTMSVDSLKSTRAIRASVSDSAAAKEMFDSITYRKGAAVLRMLESVVGEKAFQQGITRYLTEHSYANAEAGDFWNAIASLAKDLPVAKIMHGYVLQKGYPQVNVKFSPDGKTMFCSQYRKLAAGQDKQDPSLWLVPLVVRRLTGQASGALRADQTARFLFNAREQQFDLKAIKPLGAGGVSVAKSQPMFLNAGGTGYYVTCYDRNRFAQIQSAYDKLSPEEKLVFLSDCESLVLSGDVSVEDYFCFVHRLTSENDPRILNVLLKLLLSPYDLMTDRTQTGYQRWVRYMSLPLKTQLGGWEQKPDDTESTKELRASVLTLLGTQGQDKKTIAEALLQFHKYLHDKYSVLPDLLPTVFEIVAFNGGQTEYDEMMALAKAAKDPVERERALTYLTCFHQKEMALRTLAFAMGNDVRLSESPGLITGVAGNYYTRDIGWSFLKNHWNEIVKKFPEHGLRDFALSGSIFDTAEQEQDVRVWHASHPVPYGQVETARMLESLHLKVLYRQRYSQRIRAWVLAEVAKIPGTGAAASH